MGVLSPPRPARPVAALAGIDLPEGLDRDAATLAAWLRLRWFAAPVVDGGPGDPAGPALAAMLRAAHAGAGRFEDGWRVVRDLDDAAILVERAGVRRVAGAGSWLRLDRPGVPPAPGDAVAVAGLLDAVDAAGTTWCAWSGDAPLGEEVVTLFWSAPAGRAAEVVAAVGGRLREAGVGHALRAPLRPGGWRRAGALEVSVDRRAVARAAGPVRLALGDLDGVLAHPVPPLALRLAPGLAVAEPPPGGTGFARHRAAAVAAGLVGAAGAGATGDATIVHVLDALAAAGIDPDRPHLLWPARRDDPLAGAGW